MKIKENKMLVVLTLALIVTFLLSGNNVLAAKGVENLNPGQTDKTEVVVDKGKNEKEEVTVPQPSNPEVPKEPPVIPWGEKHIVPGEPGTSSQTHRYLYRNFPDGYRGRLKANRNGFWDYIGSDKYIGNVWWDEVGEYVIEGIEPIPPTEGEDGKPGTPGSDGTPGYEGVYTYTLTMRNEIKREVVNTRPLKYDWSGTSDGKFEFAHNVTSPASPSNEVTFLTAGTFNLYSKETLIEDIYHREKAWEELTASHNGDTFFKQELLGPAKFIGYETRPGITTPYTFVIHPDQVPLKVKLTPGKPIKTNEVDIELDYELVE